MGLMQLALRHKIERFLQDKGAHIHGAGTDLTDGTMDISFDIEGNAFKLDLRRIEKDDWEV